MLKHKSNGIVLIFVIFALTIFGGLFSYQTITNYITILRKERENRINLAKNNAIFALQTAIGELQTLAGQDKIVTANSDIINGIANVRTLTGVWSTDGKNANFIKWLTSSKDANSIEYAFKKTGEFSPYEQDYKISSDIIDLNINGKHCGRYAYWVSDESRKANISVIDRYSRSDNFFAKTIQFLCPQKFGLDEIFGKNSSIENNFAMTKIDFAEQLAYISGDVLDKFIKNKNDLTLHSYGVLSDTKNGGLKTDLTELSNSYDTSLGNTDLLFNNQTSLPCYIPTLQALMSFITTQANNGSVKVCATDNLFRPQFLVDYSKYNDATRCAELGYTKKCGIYPIITQAILNIGLVNIDGKISIAFTPSISIWNPYTVDLETNDYTVELCVPNSDDYDPHLTLIGNNDIKKVFLGVFQLKTESRQYTSTILKFRFSTKIKRGEVKTFSLDSTDILDVNHRNLLINKGPDNNFVYIPTKVDVEDLTNFEMSCTDRNGLLNRGWNCFYWKLSDQHSGKILQEVAELNPIKNLSLKQNSNINNNFSNYFSFFSRMRYGTLDDAAEKDGTRWLANANPRAPYISRSYCQGYSSPFLSHEFISGNWSWKTEIFPTKILSRTDNAQINYLDGLCLFDVPSKQCGVLNVGYLRHANLLPFGYFSSQIIGSSRTNPLMPINKIFYKNQNLPCYWQSHPNVESLVDYSYLLNGILFDKFFFSTRKDDGDIDSNLKCLLNKRFKFKKSFSSYGGPKSSAEHLLINGPFNVNSCSRIAWTSALSGVKDSNSYYIFPRFYSKNTERIWNSLSIESIKKLAARLVDNIKSRNIPFTSIGNFINRNISENIDECTDSGLLKKAIDDSKINSRTEKNFVVSNKNSAMYNDIVASGFLEENLPNIVNQADILQSTSHFLTTRGDTFSIIAYGDSFDGTDNKVERACCEAIVQRLPDFIDNFSNSPNDSYDDLSYLNKKFGRRFKIILFRWLNADAIGRSS